MSTSPSNVYEIVLHDPERETDYTIQLNYEDYLRFQNDDEFANNLLHANRLNQEEGNENLEDQDKKENTKLVVMWNYNQTKCLIQSMGNHINDLNHPRKRKHVFDHITNDLLSNGYNVNVQMVQNKWRSLIRSYNKAKDNKNKTGLGPTRFLFYDIIDEILGDKLSNNCTHSLNSTEDTQKEKIKQISSTETSDSEHVPSENSLPTERISVEESDLVNNNKNEIKTKRKYLEKNIQKEYLEVKKDEYRKRQKRHDEKIQIQQNKIELEKKKLELLEIYLRTKTMS